MAKLSQKVADMIAKHARQGRTPSEIAEGLGLALSDVARIFERDNLHPKVYSSSPLATKSSEIGAERALENIKHQAESDLRYARAELAKFAASFGTDSAHAFEWSSDAFKQAARERIAVIVLAYFDHLEGDKVEPESLAAFRGPKAKLAIMAGEFYRETINKAKWPDHSTSAPSNELSLCLNSRRAEVLEGMMTALARHAPELLATVIG